MTLRTTHCRPLVLGLFLAACADVGGADDAASSGAVEIGKIEQAAYVFSSLVWPMSDGVATIPVCWESTASNFPSEKTWVKSIIERSFEGDNRYYINFTGWGNCTSGLPGIHIQVHTGGAHTNGAGTQLDGSPNGMFLNFTGFGAANSTCLASEASRQACIQGIALHEFMHALGFAHEQNRPDTPETCTRGPQGENGDVIVGNWDPDSVTNYCNPALFPTNLSTQDQSALARFYGTTTDVFVAESDGNFFQDVTDWHPFFCAGSEQCLTGDFNGDGRADIAAFTRGDAADVFVSVSTGTYFSGSGGGARWHDSFCSGQQTCRVGDVNGDGKDDIFAFSNDNTADVFVALSTGTSFGASRKWHNFFCTTGEYCDVGDITGDGKADIVAFTRGDAADVFVSVSVGNGFSGSGGGAKRHDFFCAHNETCRVGDVTGDGKADIIAFTNDSNGDVFVSVSTGTGFVGSGGGARWHSFFCLSGEQCEVADATGDGKADIIAFSPQQMGRVFVSRSNGSSGFFGSGGDARWATGICLPGDICKIADVTGDGRADVLSFMR